MKTDNETELKRDEKQDIEKLISMMSDGHLYRKYIENHLAKDFLYNLIESIESKEPTLKSSEGLVEAIDKLLSFSAGISNRRNSHYLYDGLSLLKAQILSTITPTPETASEGRYAQKDLVNARKQGYDQAVEETPILDKFTASEAGKWISVDDTPVPEDRYIERWHKIWKCSITVCKKPKGYVEATLAMYWPDDAFTPHWREASTPPTQDNEGEG